MHHYWRREGGNETSRPLITFAIRKVKLNSCFNNICLALVTRVVRFSSLAFLGQTNSKGYLMTRDQIRGLLP